MSDQNKSHLFGYVLVICLLTGIFSAYQMATERLWGHWPLAFFLSCWMLPILWLMRPGANRPDRRVYFLAGSAGSILLALSFPPVSWSFLNWLAWVPVLWMTDRLIQKRISPWFYLYHVFVLWNILNTYWVANAALMPAFVAIWLNSFFMLIPWWLARKTKLVVPVLGWWPLLFYWVSYEQIHHQWELSWPWLSLGNSWAGLPSMIQWYEFTGTMGGSLWIWLINLMIYGWICRRENPLSFRISGTELRSSRLWYSLAIAIIPVLVSLWLYSKPERSGQELEVAVVQPNFEPHYEKFEVDEYTQLRRFDSLSRTVTGPSTRYLIFPETSFGDAGPIFRHNQMQEDGRILYWKKYIDSFPGLQLVMGITSLRDLGPGEPLTRFARKYHRSAPPRYYEIENAAIQLTAGSDSIMHYRKSKLVPGAEIFPYREWLPFLSPVVDKLGGSLEGLATQPDREVFGDGPDRIAPVICYESVYGDYMRGYILNGAEAIFVMTNDGWWDDTPGYRQHMAYACLRAIEFRKPVIRSANSGISCFIDDRGRISKATSYGVPAAIVSKVRFSEEMTFFARHGDVAGNVCRLVALIFLLLTLLLWIKKEWLEKI